MQTCSRVNVNTSLLEVVEIVKALPEARQAFLCGYAVGMVEEHRMASNEANKTNEAQPQNEQTQQPA